MFGRSTLLAALSLVAAIGVPHAQAQTAPSFTELTPHCLAEAANLQHLPITIILAVMKTEGGHVGSEVRNRDGSHDLGPMQINDRTWLPVLSNMHFDGDRAMARQQVRDNGCYNVNVGAWIFKKYLVEANGDFATAIGYYNSHNPGPMHAYQQRVAKNFAIIVNELRPFMMASGG